MYEGLAEAFSFVGLLSLLKEIGFHYFAGLSLCSRCWIYLLRRFVYSFTLFLLMLLLLAQRGNAICRKYMVAEAERTVGMRSMTDAPNWSSSTHTVQHT